MGVLLAAGSGLALFQMTSLVLGPGGSRQLPLSLNLPSVDVVELPTSAPSVSLVVGPLATLIPAAPAPSPRAAERAIRSATSAAVSTAHKPVPAATATSAPVATGEPSPAGRPQPPVRPTPTSQPVPDSSGD